MDDSKNNDYSDESTSDEWGEKATDDGHTGQENSETLQITEVDDSGAPIPEEHQQVQNDVVVEGREADEYTPISGKNVYIFVVNDVSKDEEEVKGDTAPEQGANEAKDNSADESKTAKAKKDPPKEVAETKPPRPKKRYAMLKRRRRARKGERYSRKAKLTPPSRSRSRSSVRKRTNKAKDGSAIELKECKETLDINKERLRTDSGQKRRHGVKRSRSSVMAVNKVLKDLQEDAAKEEDTKSGSVDKEPEEKRRKLNDN